MKKVTIYFVGGTSMVLTECDNECVENFRQWLEDDKLKVFNLNNVNIKRESIIRKELVLFINIE